MYRVVTKPLFLYKNSKKTIISRLYKNIYFKLLFSNWLIITLINETTFLQFFLLIRMSCKVSQQEHISDQCNLIEFRLKEY